MFWHWHKWKVKGVTDLVRNQLRFDGQLSQCPVTEVLLVCDCHAVQTITLDGRWTLEQLQPKPQADSDSKFLKKLGVKL